MWTKNGWTEIPSALQEPITREIRKRTQHIISLQDKTLKVSAEKFNEHAVVELVFLSTVSELHGDKLARLQATTPNILTTCIIDMRDIKVPKIQLRRAKVSTELRLLMQVKREQLQPGPSQPLQGQVRAGIRRAHAQDSEEIAAHEASEDDDDVANPSTSGSDNEGSHAHDDAGDVFEQCSDDGLGEEEEKDIEEVRERYRRRREAYKQGAVAREMAKRQRIEAQGWKFMRTGQWMRPLDLEGKALFQTGACDTDESGASGLQHQVGTLHLGRPLPRAPAPPSVGQTSCDMEPVDAPNLSSSEHCSERAPVEDCMIWPEFRNCGQSAWVVSFPKKKDRIAQFNATERDMAELVLEECRRHPHRCMEDLKHHVQQFRFLLLRGRGK